MTVTSVGTNQSQTLGTLVLQSLLASQNSSQATSGLSSSSLGDLLNLSSTSQQLAKAPAAVTQAMDDLFSTQKDVKGDLATLKNFFKDHPQNLTQILATFQGGSPTYGASGSTGTSTNQLLALLQGQSGSSSGNTQASLLSALLGAKGQDPLLSSLGDSDSSSSSGVLSLLG
jgi:hypothetical protein